MNQTSVRAWQAGDEGRWDEFAASHKLGSPFHTCAWKRAIERTFGFRAYYLLAERDGRVAGVLPLFLVKNLLSGKTLISTPYAVYGGVLAVDDEARETLRAETERLSRELRVAYTEMRNAWPEQVLGWEPVDRYSTFTQAIGPSAEAILAALPRETRRMTRRALENPYDVRETRDLDAFYALYTANLRKLGTPAFPRKHFVHLMEEFPDADVREIRLEGRMAAVVMNFYRGGSVLPYYGASDPEFNSANPNNFMYYDLMCAAGARGLTEFDFGRSKKGSGSYGFKTRWGMVERALPYEILLGTRDTLPNFSPSNPKFELALKIWQRVPLPLTRLLGPLLIRLVP